MASTVQICRQGWEKRRYMLDGWMDGWMEAYWHILARAIPLLVFPSSATYTDIKGESEHSSLCEDGLECRTMQLTFLLHPSFSFFIPKVHTCTLALAHLLSVAGWRSLSVVSFPVEDTVLCSVRKVASVEFTSLCASTRFPKAKSLRKAGTTEPVCSWRESLCPSVCVRHRGGMARDRSAVSMTEQTLFCYRRSQITGDLVCHPAGRGTGRQQSETDLGGSIFPSFLNTLILPQRSALRGGSNPFLAKENKTKTALRKSRSLSAGWHA